MSFIRPFWKHLATSVGREFILESLGDRRQRARLLEGRREQSEAAAASTGGSFDTDGCVDQSRSHSTSWSALDLSIAGLKWGDARTLRFA